MGSGVSHSDPEVSRADWGFTAERWQQITAGLQERLRADFHRLMGVSLPRPGSGPVFVQDYAFWRTEAERAMVAEYERGASTAVAAQISDAVARSAALAVVQGLLTYVQDEGGVAAGGYAASALIDKAHRWVSTAIGEVDIGRATEWGTPSDFFLMSFGFFVWTASAALMARSSSDGPRLTVAPSHWRPPR